MKGHPENKFVVRVYGLLIHGNKILLSDERLKGYEFTKFPGGGLEFGEGLTDGLRREMTEETGLNFNVISHFYTTDFYQESAFNSHHQIISVYYLLEGPEPPVQLLSDYPMDFRSDGDEQRFRWMFLGDLTETSVTFPIDKKVVEMVKKQFS